jgi:hypothetical protein
VRVSHPRDALPARRTGALDLPNSPSQQGLLHIRHAHAADIMAPTSLVPRWRPNERAAGQRHSGRRLSRPERCWFDVADVEPGASGEALVGGGVDHRRRPTHRTGRAVESNDEAVRGGLQLLSAAALDLSFTG